MKVATLSLRDRGLPVHRRRNDKGMREADGRGAVAPRSIRRLVAVAVPTQVESGARTDLEDPQSHAGAMRDLQESSDQRGAASDLVRLPPASEAGADPGALVDKRLPADGPRGPRITAAPRRWVMPTPPRP